MVFGAETLPHGPSRELRARLDHAAILWRSGVAPMVIVTGGIDGALDEVTAMSEYLASRDVTPIVPARPGQNTRDSLAAVARLAAPPRSIVAVSTAYHAHRIETEARRHGLRAATSAPADSPELRVWRLHRVRQGTELVACLVYAMPSPVATGVRRLLGRSRHRLPLVAAQARSALRTERARSASSSSSG